MGSGKGPGEVTARTRLGHLNRPRSVSAIDRAAAPARCAFEHRSRRFRCPWWFAQIGSDRSHPGAGTAFEPDGAASLNCTLVPSRGPPLGGASVPPRQAHRWRCRSFAPSRSKGVGRCHQTVDRLALIRRRIGRLRVAMKSRRHPPKPEPRMSAARPQSRRQLLRQNRHLARRRETAVDVARRRRQRRRHDSPPGAGMSAPRSPGRSCAGRSNGVATDAGAASRMSLRRPQDGRCHGRPKGRRRASVRPFGDASIRPQGAA